MKWYLTVIGALLITFVVLRITSTPDVNEGVAFAISDGTTSVFASNEDQQVGEPIIYFRRATATTYGSVLFGSQLAGEQYYESGINQEGLAWDFVPMPGHAVTPHSNRDYMYRDDDIFVLMTQSSATVAEALDFLEQVDFGLYIEGQIVLADATGASAIVSPDTSGEMVYTLSTKSYQAATNFNPATMSGDEDSRYVNTVALLENIDETDLPVSSMAILNELSQKDDLRYTIYSFAVDLPTQTIHLVYKRQFDDALIFTLEDYLTQYNQQLLMRDLFDDDVVEAGSTAFQEFDQANTRVQVWGIVVGMALNASVIALLIKWMRDERKGKVTI